MDGNRKAEKGGLASAERVRHLLHYEPDTGALTRRVEIPRCRAAVGDPVGFRRKDGYLEFSIDSRLYLAHRVIWLWVHGEWPRMIDHISGDRRDNRLVNLREASPQQNSFNQGIGKRNKSGVTGVHWNTRTNGWRVSIQAHGVSRDFGTYQDLEKAKEVRKAVELRLFGEWSRV